MNYEQRINALRQLKSSISNSSIEDSVGHFNGEVSGWEGGFSEGKYLDYVDQVKQDSQTMVSQKFAFESEIETRIATIQGQYDSEYNSNTWYFSTQQDPDPIQDRQLKSSYLRNLYADESVKSKLRRNFL